jgi:hypothetical protein
MLHYSFNRFEPEKIGNTEDEGKVVRKERVKRNNINGCTKIEKKRRNKKRKGKKINKEDRGEKQGNEIKKNK